MNLIYNENKYILKIEKDDISIGCIQENILKTCSLMIYNIENTEIFLKNGKSFILGSNECIFKEKISNFIKNNIDEITNNDETINYLSQIDKFTIYDRKRDEKGNVIKNNIIIDNYNTWFEENENLKYLSQSNIYNQPTYQNNNIISLFSNIFENSILNYQNDNEYINNLFRNYVNVNNEQQLPNTPTEEQTDEEQEDEEEQDENIQPINTTINEVQLPDISEPIINDVPINNNEFSNMVNIFDTYINNSTREQYINNNRNSILYNYFNNMYNTVNNRNTQNNTQVNNDQVNNDEILEDDDNTRNNTENNTQINNDEIQDNNGGLHENNDYIQLNNDVNEFITENNINTFINNAPIFNLLRNMSNNIEIDEPTIINSNDDYITFTVPISIYSNNNNQHNFEDIVVSLTDDEFNSLTCYECNDEDKSKDCNICIECFNKGDNIVKLNCNHEFHKDCIKKWLCDNSTKCPVCRVEVAKGKANL